MTKPTGIKMPPASRLASCVSTDAITIVIDRKDEQSMLCDPNHGGCANFRPIASFVHIKIEGPFDKADSLLKAASDEERREAAARLKKHLDSPVPKPAALIINPDRLCTHCAGDAFRKAPAAGADLISCRSQHHKADEDTGNTCAAAASNFPLREPFVIGGNSEDHFRAKRVPVCNDCIATEIDSRIYDRALYGKWDVVKSDAVQDGAGSSKDKKPPMSRGKARAPAKAEMNNPTPREGPKPPSIDLSASVLPLAYFPPVLNPPQAVRRDHVRTDYFALSPQGKIMWWTAAIERVLQKAPGDYLPEGEEMDKLLRILSGEEKAECESCGGVKSLERGFAVRVYVRGAGGDKGVVLEAGDECLTCQNF